MAKTDDLEAQLLQARKDIETLAAMASSTAKDAAGDAVDLASHHLDSLSEEARDAYAVAIKEARKANAAAQEQIKDNPLAAISIAFGLGMIISLLFSRR